MLVKIVFAGSGLLYVKIIFAGSGLSLCRADICPDNANLILYGFSNSFGPRQSIRGRILLPRIPLNRHVFRSRHARCCGRYKLITSAILSLECCLRSKAKMCVPINIFEGVCVHPSMLLSLPKSSTRFKTLILAKRNSEGNSERKSSSVVCVQTIDHFTYSKIQ